MENVLTIIVVTSAWLLFCVAMWHLHRARQRNNVSPEASLLIVYASQTGNSQLIAKRCARALHLSEMANVIPLNNLSLDNLSALDQVLFIVSTYGDGEAPDNGNLFIKRINNEINNSGKLSHLQFSVIALGDNSYPKFCAFGYQLHQAMLNVGAQSNNEVIAVDKYNEQTTSLASITPPWLNIQNVNESSASVSSLQYWQLTERLLLNPDCDDEQLLQLSFNSIGPTPNWQAGDLIDIQPHQSKDIVERWLQQHEFDGDTWLTHNGHQQSLSAWLALRELPEKCVFSIKELLDKLPYLNSRSYSVASISEQGQLQLIVRLIQKENNILGLASGYLSHHCHIGSIIQGQIRSISAHHSIDTIQPLILIGAGSGLAGLKAQIDTRTYFQDKHHKKTGPTWLIFGERNSNKELPINKYLLTLQGNQLAKLSCAYSQDSNYTKYVHHTLTDEESMLKQWISEGAVIYVCGCLSGMGESVHSTLIELLGQEQLDELQLQQRYIRDVY